MGELTLERREVWEVVEQGYGGRKVVRGVFSDEAEAWARYEAILAREPSLGVTGSLGVAGRTLEVPRDMAYSAISEAPSEKMRRAGRDYEDKAISGGIQNMNAAGAEERGR